MAKGRVDTHTSSSAVASDGAFRRHRGGSDVPIVDIGASRVLGTPGLPLVVALGRYASVRSLSEHQSLDAYFPLFVLRDSLSRLGESHLGEGAFFMHDVSAGTAVRGLDSGEDVCDDAIVNNIFSA